MKIVNPIQQIIAELHCYGICGEIFNISVFLNQLRWKLIEGALPILIVVTISRELDHYAHVLNTHSVTCNEYGVAW